MTLYNFFHNTWQEIKGHISHFMTYIRAQWQTLSSAGKQRVGQSRHKYREQSITLSYLTHSELPADNEQSGLNFSIFFS